MYCDRNRCNTAFTGLTIPNGIARARDGLIYVADTVPGTIHVLSTSAGASGVQLRKEDEIDLGLPLDNLSIDKLGNIYAAAFPQVHRWIKSSKNPALRSPVAVFQVSRANRGRYGEFSRKAMEPYTGAYTVLKILEDDGGVLSGVTAVAHDTEKGRLFLSGVMVPYIMKCDTR